MSGLNIFGVPMTLEPVRPFDDRRDRQTWSLPIGEWKLIVMTANDRSNGFWWAVETASGSTTITSDYRPTAELAAKAIEAWLEDVRCRVVGLQAQGRAIAAEPGGA